MVKKLVVETYMLSEQDILALCLGHEVVCFVDPETGKIYNPNNDFEVTGDALETMFHEVTVSE